jgi:hypothetical protein
MTLAWASDFEFSGRNVRVKKTGARLVIDRTLLTDVWRWASLYAPVRVVGALRRVVRPSARVWFAPDKARPWYLVWNVATWAGARFASRPEDADVAFFFDDSTRGVPPAAPGLRVINGRCTDVSKSRVAEAFEAVFGYPLAVDPRTWTGPAVEKGELNGAHDGRTVLCPTDPLPGRIYQRVVDNSDGEYVDDLRTPMVAGRPAAVFVKRRPLRDRYANYNTRVTLTTPGAVFSPDEVERLSAFAAEMGLDWGGLDVLRDRASGRLYVVDVNKTDMGPPLALPWTDKLRAVGRLAKAFRTLVETRPEDRP